MKLTTNSVAIIIDPNNDDITNLSSVIRENFDLLNIHTATSSAQAMEIINQLDSLDWIFFDSNLTEPNCFDFINSIKDKECMKSSKTILLSSDSNQELLLQAAASGVHEFLLKPYSANTIIAKVRKLAFGQQQRQSKRISLLEAFDVTIRFGPQEYRGSIVDLSLGGCMVKSSVFNQGGGFIYDKAKIALPIDENFIVEAELIRLERDLANEGSSIFAAFIFQPLKLELKNKFSNFLANLSKPKD